MEFNLLGPVEVSDDHRTIVLAGAKQTALLARLVLDANRVVPVHQLTEDLWDGHPPPSAIPTLHGYIAALRRALQPAVPPAAHMLQTRRPGYVLEVEPEAIDVHRFEALVRDAALARQRTDWATAEHAWRSALALWRGAPLADVASHGFARTEGRRLEELRFEVIEGLVSVDLAMGRHAQVVGQLESLVASAPLREQLTASLMLALYRCGRQADALDRYHQLHRRLAEELGIDPSPELQALHESVLLQKPELDWEETDRSPARPAPEAGIPVRTGRHNLPLELTTFVGREQEEHAVARDLRDTRIVTLIGAGGVGKSRLALRVAGAVLDRFPDGVWLVELAAVEDPSRVPDRVLSVFDHAASSQDAPRELADAIGESCTLLILDNCDHLIGPCGALVAALLRECENLRVLATSREPLHVPGERLRRVASLPVPEPAWHGDAPALEDYAAARLFIDRASATDPDFHLDLVGAQAVAQICRRLDGIPLAIELAAARVRVISPPDLALRLDGRFELLEDEGGAVLPRHRTLGAVMDWSYQLLSEPERRLLRQLSVFAGSFDLEAVARVCSTDDGEGTIQELLGLVDKSLVASEDRAGRRVYWLLETVRQYARGKLEESEGELVRDRHARHYLDVATRAEPRLYGTSLTEQLAVLAADHENFRAALDHLARRDDPAEVELAAALWRYSYLRGHYRDGRAWVTRALARVGERSAPDAVASATRGAATLAFLQCDYAKARMLSQEALRRYRELGDRGGEGGVLSLLGSIAREQGAYERAIGLHEQSLAIAEEVGDLWAIANCMQMCGFAAWLSGDFSLATAWADRHDAACARLGDVERTAWGMIDRAAIAHYTKDATAARRLLEESLALCRTLSFKEGIAWSLDLLGLVSHAEGDHGSAAAHLLESLRVHAEVGDRWRAASVLEGLAAAHTPSEPQLAARLLGAAAGTRVAIGAPIPPCEAPLVERTRATLGDLLGPQELEAVGIQGSSWSIHKALHVLDLA